jgi:hypothetical protein
MSYRASARRGAIIGLGIGIAAALLLLTLGEFSTGEPMEGAMYLAMPLSLPVGLLFFGMGVGGPTSTWMPFIALAVPLNASMWGALFGVVRDRWNRPPSRPAA